MPELGEDLSGREIDVLKCVADGATNKEVASKLDISPYTVKTHLRNIYTKLGAGSRTEAIRVGQEKGFLTVPNQAMNGHGVAAIEASTPPLPIEPVSRPDSSQPNQVQQNTMPNRPNWILFGLVGFALILVVGGFIWVQGEGFSSEPASYTIEEMGNKWSVIRGADDVRPDTATAVVGLSIFQIGGIDGAQPLGDVTIVNTVDQVVTSGTAKPTAVSHAASAVLLGEIYIIGGIGEDGNPTGNVEAFSPANNAWRPMTSLPTPLSDALAVATQDALFVIGGHDGNTAVSTFYKFDLTEERWIELPEMPNARVNPAGDILNDQLIVVGGENESGILTSCSNYDLDSESWSACSETINSRTKGEAISFLGRLYLFGGQLSEGGAQHVAEIYNIESDTWEPVDAPAEFDEWRYWEGLEVSLVGPDIYISGGEVDGEPSSDIYIFSPFPNRVYLPTTQTE
ncbi:MAG: kelch repeat-containing protein [Chloroflexota bacterium]